jgi:hypothetical protein
MEGRFNMLPIREQVPGMGPSVFNKRSLATPGFIAALMNAFTAPGRAVSGAPGFNPKEEAANFAGSFTGGGLVGSRLAPPPRGALGMGVFHGSPHKFDAFDLSKIGTGEGAQAYGHGLYFAENPAVARSYMAAGGDSPMLTVTTKGGQEIYGQNLTDAHLEAIKALELGAKDAGEFPHNTAYYARRRTQSPEVLKIIDEWKDAEIGYKSHKSFYHVDIPDEAIGRMLDWDAPLAQQPEAARKLLAAVQAERAAADAAKGYSTLKLTDIRKDSQGQPLNEMSGGQLYNYLSAARYGGSQAKATEALRAAGIPGIRYLDQGSRSSGNGTRNFVLFDDKLAKITKRE